MNFCLYIVLSEEKYLRLGRNQAIQEITEPYVRNGEMRVVDRISFEFDSIDAVYPFENERTVIYASQMLPNKIVVPYAMLVDDENLFTDFEPPKEFDEWDREVLDILNRYPQHVIISVEMEC